MVLVKKIKASVVLWFLHLFDYRLSSKAKRNVLIGLAVLVTLGFFGFIANNIIQSHNEGAKIQKLQSQQKKLFQITQMKLLQKNI